MGKNWRINPVVSCKVTKSAGEKEDCTAKIRLIFKGASSDIFIDDFDFIDISGMSFKLKFNEDIKEEKEDLGELKEKETSVGALTYKLKQKYEKNHYTLNISNKDFKNPLLYIKNTYLYCSTLKDGENLIYYKDSLHIYKHFFSSKYIDNEGYINIVIELALNIRINCEMEGASEDLIEQGDKRESCIVPLSYKSGYYTTDKGRYPDNVIARSSRQFSKFRGGDDTIGFKAVNYRPHLYTGINHTLSGSTFKTKLEKKYYHSELIESKVYVLLEVKNQFYQFMAYTSEFSKLRKEINTIDGFKSYLKEDKEKKFQIYKDKLQLKQFIFIFMQFDGKALTFKEVAIDKVDFTNSGQLKKKG